MRISNKCLVSIAFLACTASACADADLDPQSKIERTLDRPDAAFAVSLDTAAADLTTVGQFRGTVNGTTGELTIDMLGPDQVTDAGLRKAAQGLCALEIVQDGVAGSGPANSLELVTDNTGLNDACPAAAGAPAFCGDVTIRSFYTRPLANLYAQIDSLVPSSGFAVANGDQIAGASSGLGSWAYPTLEAAGGANSATRNWLFNRSGGNFTFTGRVVANVPELCNGLDDDCDGIVDEGAQCRGLGAACTATADCATDLTCSAGLCRTQCGDGNLEAMEQCDEGNAITETCAYGATSCTVCDSLCQLVPGAISSCGDATVNAPFEGCDDGNLTTEACPYGAASCTVCDPACQPVAGAASLCGDGTTDPAHEQCDDGNTVTDNCPYGATICSVCDSNCRTASGNPQVCGDSIVNGAESCDDGNQTTERCAYGETACTVCNATCASAPGATAFCGDGLLAATETCDDGNMVDGDSCSSLCTCGTGYHLEGGSCQADTRACSVANGTGIESWGGSSYGACQATLCDATFHIAGLLCESDVRLCSVTGGSGTQPWNGTAFAACVATACTSGYSLLAGACVAVGCGNSVVEAGEACDDGNESNTDGCTTVCTVAACGDGFVQSGEACDEGNTVTEACAYGQTSCTVCSATCALVAGATSFCGDGILAATETCDDGNTVDGDACSNSCTCGGGFHLESGLCLADVRSCTVANGTGAESWNGASYSACQATTCDATFHIAGLLCESDVRVCSVTGGSGTQQWNGTAFAACIATACSSGYSLLTGTCVEVGCGNSVVESGEACDDGNSINTDGCTNACALPACGDGFLQAAEGCDEGNTVTEACAYGQTSCTVCSATCALVAGAATFCGDSVVQSNETCDDGNANNADSCSISCQCGTDYHLEGGLCTPDTRSCAIANGTGSQSWTGASYSACQATSCNATFHVAGLLCESDVRACTVTGGSGTQSWNGSAFDGCVATSCTSGYSLLTGSCVAVGCGNRVVESGEACDDGNTVNTDGCTNTCRLPACGDGFVQAAEGCDEGNTVTEACTYGQTSCTICNATCQLAAGAATFCGDSVVQSNETCDDGNTNSADGCANDCGCSVGFHLEGGSCTIDTKSCTIANGTGSQSWTGSAYGSCQVASCNSGFHAAANLCEANTRSCTVTGGSGTQSWNGSAFASCVATSCTTGYSLLSGTCVVVGCGNSVVESGEACDDGNSINTDSCTNACALPACGDGYQQAGEGCDEGNTVTEVCTYGQTSCTVCNATCQFAAGAATFCGDGIKQSSEVCDDGNTSNADSCSTSCQCGAGFHLEGGSCTIDTKSCTIANGAGTQSWTGTAYGTCQVASCNSGFHVAANLCEANTRSCTVTGGSGTQTWNGSAFASCVATSCTTGYSLLSGTCVAVGCGNSVVETGEACDDGNSVNTDSCTNACKLPACGDGFKQSGEGCDEGNTVTEACTYGQTSCTVCNATCQLAAGATTFCGDGIKQGSETCDDGNTNNADSCSNSCACGTGYHLEGGICTIDTKSCTTANGTGSQTWTGAAYGSCTATSCNAGYTVVSGACVNSRSCTVANGAGTQSWSGSAWNACVATSCSASFHIEAGICAADSRVCSAGNGSGTQSWTSGAWGSCQLSACNSTYHLVSGSCVSDTQSCTIANGSGTQSWTGSAWGSCTASSCSASYHVESGACASDTRACTVTGGTGTQTWSGGAYSTCAATACTTGYHLETATCVADTRSCTVTNGTGSQNWNASTAIKISAGDAHSCATKQDGSITCWGDNSSGQTSVPSGANNFADVAAGGDHTCAVRSNGTVACWGQNGSNQTNVTAGLNSAIKVDTGYLHSCALKSNGTVACWGYNGNGETTVSGSLTGVTAIDLGDYFSCALKSDGTVACWGDNSSGKRTPTSGLNTATQISAGSDHACARKSDGTVVCWGSDTYGQRSVSGGLTGVTQVSAGGRHTCALRSDGTVSCWGSDAAGQRTVPAGLTGVTQISASWVNTCALKSDKSVVCWGDNSQGQRTPPVGVSPATWTDCALTACNSTYHVESGACVSDTRACTVTGGSGTETWNGTSYAACVATACTTGYNLVSGACTRAGNILVERIGDGSSTLSSNASQVSLVEYAATSGALLFTSTAFSSGTYRLNDSGTTTSAGYFNIANGVIAVGGYDDSLGNNNILTNNNKVVNFISGSLAPTTQISIDSDVLEDGELRSVVPGPSGTFYAVGNGSGSTSGVWYYTGSTWRRVSSTSTSIRAVDIFGGQLYYSTDSGSPGIYKVGTGLPTSTGTTATRIITATSPTGFVLLDCDGNGTLERAYVADDGTSATGGLRRFDLSGSTWNASYSKLFGDSADDSLATSLSGGRGIRGITGSCAAGTATLYATTTATANNRIVKVVDSSANGTTGTPTTYTTIAGSGSNYVFRGVELRPF